MQPFARFRKSLILTNLKVLLIVTCISCSNRQLRNDFYFHNEDTNWYVIVNHCAGEQNFSNTPKRQFVFPECGIFCINDPNFKFSEIDRFYFQGNQFDPNNTDTSTYKLLYFAASANVGYNARYYSEKYDIHWDGQMEEMQDFDLYFFKVGKMENSKVGNQPHEKVWKYLLENKIYSDKRE